MYEPNDLWNVLSYSSPFSLSLLATSLDVPLASLYSPVVILKVHILFQNTEERKVGVYVRAHPTIELLEDRLYLGKRSPLVTLVETKMFDFAFSQKSDFHQSKICRREIVIIFQNFVQIFREILAFSRGKNWKR
jgi:hypothetical protein